MNKFSIIIPTYNSIKYIKQCLNSVLEQSYTNFDILIIDSGSTDMTISWIESIDDNRIKIFDTKYRLSITENWDRIKTIPCQEFMTILGHDDCLEKNFLQEINNLIEKYPNASLYQTHFNYIDEQGKKIRQSSVMQEKYDLSLFLKNISYLDIMATGFVMRTKDYKEVGGIPLYFNLLFADLSLWITLIQKNFLIVSPKICFSFRKHQSTTTTTTTDIYIKALSEFIEFLLNQKNYICYNIEIEKSICLFIEKNCQGLVYKNLQEKNSKISVSDIIKTSQNAIDKFTTNCRPIKLKYKFPIFFAIVMERFNIIKKIYLLFKKIYSQPIL